MADLDIPSLPELPDELTSPAPHVYVPSPEWETWMREVFIEEGAPLQNEDHEHLQRARIAVLLTNERYSTKGQLVLGEARLAEPNGSHAWTRGQRRQQLVRWFARGEDDDFPDFVITLYARWLGSHIELEQPGPIFALVEHELYHCVQETDDYGMPKFGDDGRPKWDIAPHDVEEFVGVARRYGARAPGGDSDSKLAELAEVLQSDPEVTAADLDGVCASCG